MIKIFIPVTITTSFCLLLILLNITNPVTAGPLGILAIFFCSYLLLTGVLAYIFHWGSRVIAYLSVVFMMRKPIEGLNLKRSYYYSTVVSAAPIMLVGLQSVGSVGIYEVSLVLIFIVIGCLYVSKRVS